MLDEDFALDGLAETFDQLAPSADEHGLHAERLVVDMPVEFYVRQPRDGSLRIEASAPTQRIRTSVLPVFHRVRIVIEADSAEDLPVERT